MAFSFFGLVWHIWWMAVLFGFISAASGIVRSFMRNLHRVIPAAEVEAEHRRWLAEAAAATPVPRRLEETPINEGLAICRE